MSTESTRTAITLASGGLWSPGVMDCHQPQRDSTIDSAAGNATTRSIILRIVHARLWAEKAPLFPVLFYPASFVAFTSGARHANAQVIDSTTTQAGASSATDSTTPRSSDYTQLRRWTSRLGKVLGEGVFIGIDDRVIRIKLTDGKVGRIHIDKLCTADKNFSKQASLALEEAEEPVMGEAQDASSGPATSTKRHIRAEIATDAAAEEGKRHNFLTASNA